MKISQKIFAVSFLFVGILFAVPTQSAGLIERVSGYILLQVEQRGEAWYVRPETGERHYTRDGDVAYQMMRHFGLGIADADLATIPAVSTEQEMLASTPVCGSNALADRVKGTILLQVEQRGEAWYVYPETCRRIYMADGDAAYQIMRFLGLGITDADLAGIEIGPDVVIEDEVEEEVVEEVVDDPEEDGENTSVYAEIEERTFDLVNDHRASLGRSELSWSNTIADIARVHSENMASGTVEPGHDGFSERADELRLSFSFFSVSENVAWTNHADPAQSGFNWWLTSEGHKSNLEHPDHTVTGIGVARSASGVYYITQMFLNEN